MNVESIMPFRLLVKYFPNFSLRNDDMQSIQNVHVDRESPSEFRFLDFVAYNL